VPLALLSCGVAGAVATLCPVAHAQQTASSGSKSWTDSISSGFKQGFSKLGHALTPKSAAAVPGPEDDAVSLKSKAKPGPDLYVAIARLYEESGKLAEAEQQYQLALKEKPDHLPALLGYAQLEDRLEKPDEALCLHQRAVKAYPQQASVYNNIGLCHARQGRLDEAAAAMNRAIQLDPKSRLYRNNLAAVLVDQGRVREAFAHLREAHGEAAAYYNLGYLLNKNGQTQAAIQHFNLALNADPSLDAARRWVEYLQKATARSQLPQHPATAGLKISSRPVMPSDDVMLSPEAPMPQRLPPTTLPQPQPKGPTLPGISYEPPAAMAAPLPPPPTNSPVRPHSPAN